MSARDRHEKNRRWGPKKGGDKVVGSGASIAEREGSLSSFENARHRGGGSGWDESSPSAAAMRPQYSSTIRSVSPESTKGPSRAATPSERKTSFFTNSIMHRASPSSSPPQQAAIRHRQSHREILRPAPGRTASDNTYGGGSRVAVNEEQGTPMSRPRTRTLEDQQQPHAQPYQPQQQSREPDVSSPTFLRKARTRVGSVASNASGVGVYRASEETVTSIGHPSTIPQPVALPSSSSGQSTSLRSAKSGRNKLAKQHPSSSQHHLPPRTASPVSSATSLIDLPPREIPTANARKIFNLMRSTCGRMEGLLAFRRGETSPWGLAYCIINDESGSLVYEPKSDASYYRTLISDLRSCEVRTAMDPESNHPYLDVIPSSSHLEVHLRPHSREEFESWFAALLCWQPIKPKGIMNRMAKPQPGLTPEPRPANVRRHSEVSLKDIPIIKVGKMIYWDTVVTSEHQTSGFRGSSRAGGGGGSARISTRRWRRVSCTLRENGELKMYSETDVSLVGTVQLAQLARCAIQRLDPSVLDAEFSIAIYPQYTSASYVHSANPRPIFLSLESRLVYESWLVLLRAFTVPQLYGPKSVLSIEDSRPFPAPPSSDMFRMERSLGVKVLQAKLLPPVSPTGAGDNVTVPRHPNDRTGGTAGGLYAEILLDGETSAKTPVRSEAPQPFWREDFEFSDLPAALSVASIRLKERPDVEVPKEKKLREEAKRMHDATGPSTGSGSALTSSSTDLTVGQVDIYLDDLSSAREVEKWWPLTNRFGQNVGEIQIGIRAEETAILLAKDYQELSQLLHRFNNGLTLQIAAVLSGQLTRLSEHLLNIFQVSGKAGDWLSNLIEEEIDSAGAGVDAPRQAVVNRIRLSKKLGVAPGSAGGTSAGGGGGIMPPVDASAEVIGDASAYDRETIVRDLGKNAAVEANLLFRANTLCTKSLDLHMRRLGREYLDATLGDKMRDIADRDPECEVDPNRVEDRQELERNWRRLLQWTADVWRCIHASWQACPAELRLILRHVMACAEDRFGDYLRTVRYSSVSGFLFLRLFCPAILGPKLFGLLKDDPKPRARRAVTLIAKIIMSLANSATFGVKEPFMEPANAFLASHRQQFKEFIDNICSIPTSTSAQSTQLHPNYSTPIAIIGRMPLPAREGFPSLPYLIDHARSFADLVDLWLEHAKNVSGSLQSDGAGELGRFHALCLSLRRRTQDVLERAERAERPNSGLEAKWEQLVDELARDAGVSVAGSPQYTRDNNNHGAHHAAYASAPGSSHGPPPPIRDRDRERERERVGTGGGASTSSASGYAASESTLDEGWGAAQGERGASSLDVNNNNNNNNNGRAYAEHAGGGGWPGANAAYAQSEEHITTTALPSMVGEGRKAGSRGGESNGRGTVRGLRPGKGGGEGEKEDKGKSFSFRFGKKSKG